MDGASAAAMTPRAGRAQATTTVPRTAPANHTRAGTTPTTKPMAAIIGELYTPRVTPGMTPPKPRTEGRAPRLSRTKA